MPRVYAGLPMSERSALPRLNALIGEIIERNQFQRSRIPLKRLTSLEHLSELPLTTKDELLRDQAEHPPFGTNLTFALEDYTLVFQTSGTIGTPLKVLETPADWRWWRRGFGTVLRAAGLSSADRVALASSFGPYVQFWASFEASQEINALTLSLGGMDSLQRLEVLNHYQATALICTPSYALRLAKRAAESDRQEALDSVKRLVCTGEPGASLPAIRSRIEDEWGARCYDHAGLSEVGPFSYPCDAGHGLHLNAGEYLFEVLEQDGDSPVPNGQTGELIVTALGRRGFPVIRYRTGDAVRISPKACPGGHSDPWLPEGIIGRTDDMVVIRGMNVFPSAVEQILREFGGLGEYLITFYTDPNAMDEVKVEAELERANDAREIQARLRTHLGLRVRIVPLKAGSLPVQPRKARRVDDRRSIAPVLMGTRE
jgi:phenylacetate-CoA ligase